MKRTLLLITAVLLVVIGCDANRVDLQLSTELVNSVICRDN
jgi:hypothetical protein